MDMSTPLGAALKLQARKDVGDALKMFWFATNIVKFPDSRWRWQFRRLGRICHQASVRADAGAGALTYALFQPSGGKPGNNVRS